MPANTFTATLYVPRDLSGSPGSVLWRAAPAPPPPAGPPASLERLVELDLVAVDLDPAPRERLRDLLGRDRAVELAALADLHAHRQRRRSDSRRGDLGVGPLALALVLARRDVVLPCPVRAAGRG